MSITLNPVFPSTLRKRQGRHQAALRNQQPLGGAWIQIHHYNGDRYYHHPENRVFTSVDPRDLDNAAALQIATDKIHQHLAEVNLGDDVTIVIGFTKGMRRVRTACYYYLVCHDRYEIFWLEAVTDAILGVTSCRNGDCLRSLALHQYWYHVQYFPPTEVDAFAEGGLIWRLRGGQIPGNENLTPWTPEECALHLAEVEENRAMQPVPFRMARIGHLLSKIYLQLHDQVHRRNNGRNIRPRIRNPVVVVERRDDDQPERWMLIEILTDIDRPLAIILAYSVLLAAVNRAIGPKSVLNDQILLVSLAPLAAVLLLCFLSPGLYFYTAARIFENTPRDAPVHNWTLTSLLAFIALVYGRFLTAFGSYLDPPEHQLSIAGLAMVTFVLALPPAFHFLRSCYESE